MSPAFRSLLLRTALLLAFVPPGARAEPGDTHTAFTSLKPESQPGYSTLVGLADEISGPSVTGGYRTAAFRFVAQESGPLEKILVALYGYGDPGTELSVSVVLHTDAGGKLGGPFASFPIREVQQGVFRGYFARIDQEYGYVLQKGRAYWLALEPLSPTSHVAWALGLAGPKVKKYSETEGQPTYAPRPDSADCMVVDVYEPYPLEVREAEAPLLEGAQVPGEETGVKLASVGTVPQTPTLGSLRVNGRLVPALLAADGKVILRTGDPAPGLAGTALTAFRLPSGDKVLATLRRQPARDGLPAITAVNDTVLLSGLGGEAPQVLARTGDSIQDGSAAVVQGFTSLDGDGTTAFFLASLGGSGVNASNRVALCGVAPGTGVRTLVRTGVQAAGAPITRLTTLAGAPGTPVEGRWRLDAQRVGAVVERGRSGLSVVQYTLAPAGEVQAAVVAALGVPLPSPLENLVPSAFGVPGFGPAGCVLPLTLKVGTGGVTTQNQQLLAAFSEGAVKVVARQGDPAPGPDGEALPGVKFTSFSAAVRGSGEKIAFAALLSSPTERNGLWYDDGSKLRLLARQGGLAPGLGVYASFPGLLLPNAPESRPIFQATLALSPAAGITAATDAGVWGLGGDGAVHLIVREGSHVYLDDEHYGFMRSFSALLTAAGSTGAAHGIDANGRLRVNATVNNRAVPGVFRAQFSVPIPDSPPE